MRVLEIELRSSTRITNTFNHENIAPVFHIHVKAIERCMYSFRISLCPLCGSGEEHWAGVALGKMQTCRHVAQIRNSVQLGKDLNKRYFN